MASKIIVVGPTKAGKTCLADFLAGLRATPAADYHPTQGCRIVEFDRDKLTITDAKRKTTSTNTKVSVELWDVSGDAKFSSGWPAIKQDVDGVLLVFSPDEKGHDRELENFFKSFVTDLNLKPETQCMIFAHRSAAAQQKGAANAQKIKISKSLIKVPIAQTSLDYDTDLIRDEFDKLVASVYLNRRDKEESAILGSS